MNGVMKQVSVFSLDSLTVVVISLEDQVVMRKGREGLGIKLRLITRDGKMLRLFGYERIGV